MKHRTALFSVGLAGILLLTAGCTSSAEPTRSGTRPSDDGDWVHVDLKRVRRDDPFLRFDWADPTGLKAFTASITSVDRAAPHTYTGRFDPDGKDVEPFLPVGVPSIVSIGMPSVAVHDHDRRPGLGHHDQG